MRQRTHVTPFQSKRRRKGRAWSTATVVVGLGLALATLTACSHRARSAPIEPRASGSSEDDESTHDVERHELTRSEALSLLCRVYARLDSDGDRRLTIDDSAADRQTWPMSFSLEERTAGTSVGARVVELDSIQRASRLAQDLARALYSTQGEMFVLDSGRLRLSTADYLVEQIESRFWDGLTRRIEPEQTALKQALLDEKMGAATPELTLSCEPRVATESDVPLPPSGVAAPLYVPASDPAALSLFSRFAAGTSQAQPSSGVQRIQWLRVETVPERAGFQWVDSLTREHRHGLLSLAMDGERGKPFVVPGGRFNEMYGWDSFFIVWGLTRSPRHQALARAMVDHFAYEIRHYGKILNANRTYYLTRSQPPFFTRMIRLAWEASAAPFKTSSEGRRWLRHSLEAALEEYERVWTRPPRTTALCEGDTCLSRYYGSGRGEPPEVEPGHFDWVYQLHAERSGECKQGSSDAEQRAFIACAHEFAERYRRGTLESPPLDEFFVHDRCMRESGHDTSYRWFDPQRGIDRCADFATVDLNTLLLRYELDLAAAFQHGELNDPGGLQVFCERAKRRTRLMQAYLWDAETSSFFDYDVKTQRRHRYRSATGLFPLWISGNNVCGVELVPDGAVLALTEAALRELEAAGGLAATSRSAVQAVPEVRVLKANGAEIASEALSRQWDYPNGWAPHQMLAWEGLSQRGRDGDARRLAYKWLYTIARNAADYHGVVPEKLDVVRRTHKVFQEYGNVNTDFAYITEEGFGWMNASFVVGFALLNAEEREALRRLTPPEQVFVE